MKTPKILCSLPPADVVKLIEKNLDPDYTLRANLVTTYDGVIYNPSNTELTPAMIEHEKVHVAQQAAYPDGAFAYVERYCRDDTFRLRQEAEAYKVEYRYCVKHGEKQHLALTRLARKLLHGSYGFHLTLRGAQVILS